MKKYIYVGVAIIIIALIVSLNLSLHSLKVAKSEVSRLEKNERVSQSELDTFRTRNGELVAKTEALTRSVSELKKYNADLVQKLKNQNIRVKDLQEAIIFISSSNLNVRVPLHDTIIVPHVVSRVFEYKGEWNRISGIVYKDSVSITQSRTDSLYFFHYTEPYKFLFFKWGVKKEEWSVINHGLNSKILKFKVIEMKGKRED